MAMVRLPLHFKCFFNRSNQIEHYLFRIDRSNIAVHPYQLFRYTNEHWVNMSVYASIRDAVRVFLKELMSTELKEEVAHGQATLNPDEIIRKVAAGETTIVIFESSLNSDFRISMDVGYDELIDRE